MSTNFQLFIDFHDWVEDNLVVGTDGLGNDARYVRIDALQEYWQYRISPILRSCSHDTPIHVSIKDISEEYLRIFSVLAYISRTQNARLNYIKKFIEKRIDDHRLPFKDKPDAFSNAPDAIQTFKEFQDRQYLFSPVNFGQRLYSTELLPRRVLPLNIEKVLSGGNGETTIVKKCKVHPFSGLDVASVVLKEFDSSEIELSFRNEVDSYITLENKIRQDVCTEHFLTYYGSFLKGGKAFILLEYTEHGSLLDFFNRNDLPLERHELHDLWLSLSDLFIGLKHLHALDHQFKDITSGTIRGVHQDLKPANIFVFRRDDSNPYKFQFKLGDFGMSSVALVKTRNKSIRGPDNASTKMYGAPELTHHYPALDDVDEGARWDADIWSIGCVLFEVLVWTICGNRGRSEFFRMRKKDTDRVPNHESQGYSGCFHNGVSRIKAIDDMLGLALERIRIFDKLSGPIGALILNEMLIPVAECRLEATHLIPRFKNILQSHEDDPKNQELAESRLPSSPVGRSYSRRQACESWASYEVHPTHASSASETPTQLSDREEARRSQLVRNGPRVISPPPVNDEFVGNYPARETPNQATEHLGAEPDRMRIDERRPSGERLLSDDQSPHRFLPHESPSVAPQGTMNGRERGHGYARVTISQVIRWIDDKKNRRAPKPLPDHDRAMREIDNREQIFVVDDSDTMRTQHWDKVIEAVLALGYLVKPADPDGMELFLTSDPARCKKSRDSNGLVRTLEDHQRTSSVGACNMENSLSPIFDHVKNGLKSKKRASFLPRTQRRGTNVYILTDAIWEGGEEVTCGVERPIKNLTTRMRELGKDRTTVALQFIQFGNDALGKERLRYLDDTLGDELDFDIVDHRHCEDGVWHMLVGPISRGLDKDNNVGS